MFNPIYVTFKIHQCNTHNLHGRIIERAVCIAHCRLVMMNWVEFEGSTRAIIEAQSQMTAVLRPDSKPGTLCNATATNEHVTSAARTCR